MDLNKFTQKSLQAVQDCQKLAYQYGNQKIEQEHLLYSLLTIEDSLIYKLIEKMEINAPHFQNRGEQALQKRPKVQGGELRVGADLNKVLICAEDEAKRLGDEYVSVEHLFLSMLQFPEVEFLQIKVMQQRVLSLQLPVTFLRLFRLLLCTSGRTYRLYLAYCFRFRVPFLQIN